MVGAGGRGEGHDSGQADERAGGDSRRAAQRGLKQVHAYSCNEDRGYGTGRRKAAQRVDVASAEGPRRRLPASSSRQRFVGGCPTIATEANMKNTVGRANGVDTHS
ncbi:hypothetical protein Asp14428_61420 [Actinoplanes sp. NBRC 14428]|nr:hypothetical protein Asp14428_61420 [Actinoplanes sp. NBRC 14428]